MSEREGGGGDLLRGRYWSEDVSITAGASDHHLGPKGLFVASDAVVEDGALLRFELTLGDEPPITGRVRVVDADVDAVPGRARGVRMKFVQLDDPEGARALLARVDLPASPSIPPPAPSAPPPSPPEVATAADPVDVSEAPPSTPPPSSAPASTGGKKKRKGKKGRRAGASDTPTPPPAAAAAATAGEPSTTVTDEGATSERWTAAMDLDDAFFDEAPRSSHVPFVDDPVADSAMLRASDPAFQARRRRLQRTVAAVVAGATILLVAVLVRSGDAEREAGAHPASARTAPSRGEATPPPATPIAPVATTVAATASATPDGADPTASAASATSAEPAAAAPEPAATASSPGPREPETASPPKAAPPRPMPPPPKPPAPKAPQPPKTPQPPKAPQPAAADIYE